MIGIRELPRSDVLIVVGESSVWKECSHPRRSTMAEALDKYCSSSRDRSRNSPLAGIVGANVWLRPEAHM